MFKQKQWLAVVRGNHWVVAKVARRKYNLDVLQLFEYRSELESEFESEQAQEQFGENLRSSNEGFREEKSLEGKGGTASLKAWLHKNRVPIKKLRIAVSCPGVITRLITLPLMSARDLDQLLTEQVGQYFTLNISDYIVDYRVLDRLIEDGEMRLRVLLAALPKYKWEMLWSEWETIGFKPKVVDLAAEGLARLYSQLTLNDMKKKSTPDLEAPLDLAIVELSTDRVEFILLEHGVFFLYSDLEVSSDELDTVATVVKSTNRELKYEQGEEADELDLENLRLNELVKTEIESTLGNVLQSVTEFFSFFAARHFGKSIDRIYLTGDYCNLPFLKEIFETNLGVDTQVGFPNGWRPRFSKKMNIHQENGMKYGNLYGLALREG